LGDFAIIHSHMTFRTKDVVLRQGRYTDDWQRREENGSAWRQTLLPNAYKEI